MGIKLGRDPEDEQIYSRKLFGIQKQKENWAAIYNVDMTAESAIPLRIY